MSTEARVNKKELRARQEAERAERKAAEEKARNSVAYYRTLSAPVYLDDDGWDFPVFEIRYQRHKTIRG